MDTSLHIPPKPKPCATHGTHHSAGCIHCQTYGRTIARRRYRLRKLGVPVGYIDAAAARRHAEKLHATGMTIRQIGRGANLTEASMRDILYGRTQKIHAEVHEAVLAVKPEPTRWRNHILVTGTRRRLQALNAIGYGYDDLASLLGSSESAIRRLAAGHAKFVSTERDAQVQRLYEQIADRPPAQPSLRVLRNAARKGWLPPICWDDDTIDDPNAAPYLPGTPDADIDYDEAKVLRAVDGHLPYEQLTRAEAADTVRRLNRRGLTDGEIGRIVHASTNTICRRRLRMGLPANSEPSPNTSWSA